MTTDLATRNGIGLSEAVEAALIQGDLEALGVEQRLELYHRVCSDLGLNPRTQPFDYVRFKGRGDEPGKLVLYAKRNCTDQLAALRHISQSILKVETVGDIYIVHARVRTPDGRSTDNIGAVGIANKSGDFLANAFKKAVTQAYRRAVLSHVGLSFLDETEVDQVQGAEVVPTPAGQGTIEPIVLSDDSPSAERGHIPGVDPEPDDRSRQTYKAHEVAILATTSPEGRRAAWFGIQADHAAGLLDDRQVAVLKECYRRQVEAAKGARAAAQPEPEVLASEPF